jgi:TonB-linked SusC/RagA family outer membrane protein
MHTLVDQHLRRRWLILACSIMTLGGLAVPFSASAQAGQGGTIVGRVTDARTNTGIQSATVQVEATRLAATTGSDGRFRIANVPAGAHNVIVLRLGFASGKRAVTVMAGQEASVEFTLQQSAVELDQVVVTGTAGGEARRSIGNAVSRIDVGDELAKSAATNLTSLLNARSPGVSIQSTTGRVGAGPSIQIRGRSSLGLSNAPLIYVDGIRVNNASATGPSSGSFAGQGARVGGRLNDINPDDIESIEVISGPAAATIYGTEAASGVIQIITKRGRADKPELAFRSEIGSLYFKDAATRVPTNYAKDKSGAIVPWNGVQQEADSGRPIFKTGMTRQYNASLSGGHEATRYYFAAGYENDYGIEPNNSMRQFTSHLNISTPIAQSSDIAASFNFVNQSAHLGVDVGASPLIGAEVGHPLVFPTSRGFYPGWPPELEQQLWDNASGINRFTGSATLNNRPLSWFTQRAVLGIDYSGEDARGIERFAPPQFASLLSAAQASGRIGQTLRHTSIITGDYSGTAKFDLTKSLQSSTSIGGQYYNTEADTSFLGGTGFPAAGVELVSATSAALPSGQGQIINTTIGGYGQQQFAWRDRVFVTAGLRVDNNSAFGQDFKWVTYPKVSASWVLSDEPFWRWASSINTLRLRAAYGESGRQPAAFSALRTFTPVTGFNGGNGVTPGTLGNPNLKPERGKETELGFEANAFNRLSLNFTYFNKHTYDEIVSQAVAPSAGFPGSRFLNLGKVDNSGVEFQGTFQAITRRNLSWEIGGNVATNKDVIRDLGGLPTLITAAGGANKVGYPIGGYFSRVIASADRDANGFATNVLCRDTTAGHPTTACATAPFIYLGTPTPRVTGSVSNTLMIGNRLRLFGLVDFKRGHQVVSNIDQIRCSGALGVSLCRINFYPNEFPVTQVAEATVTALSQQYIDTYFTSGSFAKLRELSATYLIPEKWLRGINGASFTLAARELHTWTDYKGIDPEAFVAGSDQAVTPPLNRIIATFNLRW